MKQEMVELFSDADLARLRRQIRRRWMMHAAIAALALAICIGLMVNTRTRNAARMELMAIITSTAAGWIIIYGSVFKVMARGRELRHAMMLRSEERQAVRGEVVVTEERIAIRKSITARRVEVRGEGELERLLVCESRADALAAAGARTLYTVHGYVAAYEVTP